MPSRSSNRRAERDLEVRFENLDQAQKLLQQFVDSQSSHPKAYAARSQLGNLIVERARIKVEQAKSGNTNALLKQARKSYDEAFEEFSKLEAAVSQELEQIPKVLDTKDRDQAALAKRRTQLRADNLQTELLAAAIREETADTVPEGSKEHTDYLTEAAALYDSIYKKYRSRLAGLYARMYQGRCNHRLGKTKDALGYYGELLDQPDQPQAFWTLKTKTLRMAMESWLSPGERKYVEAIKQASEWLTNAPRNTDRQRDMLAIRLSLARAYKMQADDFQARDSSDARTIAVSLESAKKHATFVANEAGELQEEAQQLVVNLGGRQRDDGETQPATFTEAQQAGKKALDAIGPASEAVAKLQSKIQRAKKGEREKLESQLAAANAELVAAQSTAMDSYRLAMQLADQDTPPSELNLVRYFVCYLYYLDKQYFEAALVGDFVARRYPQSAGARQCARISLACYMQILEMANEDDRQFEIEQLVTLTNQITESWPDGPEALEALTTLVPVMVNANEIEHADSMTRKIPETAPGRGQAELTTGQASWGKHLQLQQEIARLEREGVPEDVDLEAKRGESEQLAENAIELLSAGYDRIPDEPTVDTFNATALLSLAQAFVASAEYSKAVKVLEHDTSGAITLVEANHDAVANPVFVEEAYRTALQAYVGSMTDQGAGAMEKAKRAMAALQQSVGTDDAGKQRMLGVYVNLAQNVEAQMKSASATERQAMSEVFEAFLQELSGGSSDVGVLNWVAETFASLGAGFDDDPDALNQQAAKYYERSIAAFENLLSLSSLDPQLATQIKVRLASVKTQKRDFQDALDNFKEVLAKTPTAVNVQVEAARLLQRWAGSDPAKYAQAISGIPSGGKGILWGWGKIANVTLPHKQFRDTFYEARYEMAKCLVGLAASKKGAEKSKLLADAERSLTRTKQLYPSLGGETWTRQYDALLKTIQSARGGK